MSQLKMFYGAKAHLFKKAGELRKNETESEKAIWDRLSQKQLGVKFRQQHPASEFILDFYCHEIKLAIEVDGEYHNTKEVLAKDKSRTTVLNKLGIRLIRFTNEQALNEIETVVEAIREMVSDLKQIKDNK